MSGKLVYNFAIKNNRFVFVLYVNVNMKKTCGPFPLPPFHFRRKTIHEIKKVPNTIKGKEENCSLCVLDSDVVVAEVVEVVVTVGLLVVDGGVDVVEVGVVLDVDGDVGVVEVGVVVVDVVEGGVIVVVVDIVWWFGEAAACNNTSALSQTAGEEEEEHEEEEEEVEEDIE